VVQAIGLCEHFQTIRRSPKREKKKKRKRGGEEREEKRGVVGRVERREGLDGM
jgi:hypothetical protein